MAAMSWKILVWVFILTTSTAYGDDICNPSSSTTFPGEITSPGYPSPYDVDLECIISLQAPSDTRIRLHFTDVDLREGDDFVMVVDQDGIQTMIAGNSVPKDFIGSSFEISFMSDGVETNGTGFNITYDEYSRVPITRKNIMDDIDLKPGKALHLYTNDYPMQYDDNTHYMWNLTSSSTGEMVISIIDMDTEDQRDWLKVTSHSMASGSEILLYASGTPSEGVEQMTVRDSDYVTVEFLTDYSRSGRGFHIIVEPDSAMDLMIAAPPVTGCGGNFTLGLVDLKFHLPENTSDLFCVWRIENNYTDTRVKVRVHDFFVEQGSEYFEIRTGLDPTDWKSYRRRLTGSVDYEQFFIDVGGSVTLIFSSGSSNITRTFHVHVGPVADYGCSGELDLSLNGRGNLFIGNFSSSLTQVYCQWHIKAPLQTNVNFHIDSLHSERNYDIFEIGTGSDPTDIGSRKKLIVGDVMDQTFSTYSGDMWLVFSAEDLVEGDNTSITISLDDNACTIKTILDTYGEIDSPRGLNGMYPDDADCQWIVQVRGGFQVRLHFLEFNLEYGHDQLIIGGANPDEDDVDSSYLVLTGSDVPADVVSRFNGLNIRLKTDSSVTKSGFKLIFQEFFDCPEGYEYDPTNETCYKFVKTPASWLEARYDCDDVADGDLVVINDATENAYVLEKIRLMQENNQTDNWWIGYYDLAINGEWVWVDCEERGSFGGSNWQPGAPNNTDDDHCAYISTDDGRFNDDMCNNNRSYVCEITRKNYVDSDCYPSNFRVRDTSFTHVDLRFTVSDYLCDVSGYKIRYNTSVPDVYEEIDLPGATASSIVISGLDHGTTYHFELTTCTVSYGCYSYVTALSVLATTVPCPDGFAYGFGESCYSIVNEVLSWVDARQQCVTGEVEDADLLNIETMEENMFIGSMISSPGDYWIGLYDVVEEGEFFWSYECVMPTYRNWVDVDHPKNPDENCVTMDASGKWNDANCSSSSVAGYICETAPRAFGSDPADVVPSFFRGTAVNETVVDLSWFPPSQFCDISGYKISVYKTTLLFDVEVMGGEASGATISGLNKGTTYTFRLMPYSFSFEGDVVPSETSVQTLGCPRGYEASEEGICYSYSRNALTWTEAALDCRGTLGADLVTIVNQTELAYLRTISDDDAWIGLSDSEVEGDFTWLSCLEWSQEPWNTPSGNTDDNDCVILERSTGQLVAENCSLQYAYFCEFNEVFDVYPTDFRAEVLSFSEILLSWTLPENLCGVTGYRVQYYTNIIRSEIQVEGADTDSVLVINLEEDTRYFFTIAPLVTGSTYPQSDPINATTDMAPPCPEDYVLGLDGACFKFSRNFATWVDARADCLQTENSDLVEITSENMTSYLTLETGNGLYWIGLYDAAKKDDWRWGSDCMAPSYTQWAPGEPGNNTGLDQDCALLNGLTGQWNDQICTTNLLYICEIKERTSSADGVSPSGLSGNSQTPSSITVTWTPADQVCDILAYIVAWQGKNGESGTQTVSGGETSRTIINNLTPATDYVIFIDTLTFSFGNLGNGAGVEVSTGEACPDGYELGATGDCYSFVRGAVEFQNARELCQQSDGGDLVVIETPREHEYIMNMTQGGDWWVGLYDVGTEGNHRWVDCSDMNIWQISNWAPGQPDDTDGTQDCGQMISSGEWMDWPCDRQNMYICELNPLNLIPRDLRPTDFTATSLSIVSIALSWVPSDASCDVTGYRIFVSQGLASTTIDLEGGTTSSYIVNELLIGTEYGFRIAALTIDGPLPYSELVTASTKNETVGCPGDYEEGYMGRCYRFVKGALTWSQARLECSKDFGGELVVVNNRAEYDYILNKTMEGDWWIGLQDQWSEDDFRWTDCSSMTAWQMTNWAPGEPDENGDGQDCVQMISSGQWMDWPCQRPNQFICEIFAKDYVPIQVAPSNFSGEGISDSEIFLTWIPSEFNCDVQGYMIEYTDLNNVVEFPVVGGDTDSAIVTELRANTPYRFSIKPLLLVDRNLDYGLPIEAITLPYPGCQEPVIITNAPGNISSPNFPSNYPPSVDCIYTISLDTRIELTFQLLFILPDPEDYVTISEMGENGYEERVRLSGIFLPKSYISEATSVQVRFVSDDIIEGLGFFLTYTEYNVELPEEKQCTNVYPLKAGPVPLLFNSPGYPNGYEDNQNCGYVFQQSSAALGDVKVAADNLIELFFTDFSLETSYDILIVGAGMDPANLTTEIDRYSGNNKPDLLRVDNEAVWLKLETDSSNADNVRGFSLGASEKSPDEIPATKEPPPINNPPWNGTCGGTLTVPDDIGSSTQVTSPNFPDNYPSNVDCVWFLQTDQSRFRIGLEASNRFQTEVGYDVVEIGRGSDPSDPATHYVSLSGSPDPFSLMIEESTAWIRFTSDFSNEYQGFSIFAEQDRDCEETIVISPITRTIRSPNYPFPYSTNEYCLWSIVSSSGSPIRAVVTEFETEEQYDMLDVGTGRGENAVSLDTRVAQLSGYVNESFTTNSILMWLAFTSDGTNNFKGFEIIFFDDMCSNEVITDSSGTIQSPGYGFQYPNYASCNWAIQVEEGYNIRLSFDDTFDLETGRDTLSIVGSRANPLGPLVLTGSEVPEDVISVGSNLIIQFSADSSVVGRGFSFTYQKFYDCPEGFVEADVNGPTCYKFVNDLSTWTNARADCRSTPGADLIIINNALENRYIRDASGGEDWWIGYYDGGQEGIFTYVECDTSTTGWAIYNWGDDQPSRLPGNQEDCVYIQGVDGYYYDDRCDLAKNYVCETLKVPDIIPDAYNPTELMTEALSPATIRLSWSPSSYRCDVTGYTITYSGPDGLEGGITVEEPGLTSYDLTGLSPSTAYIITLTTQTFSFGPLDSLSSLTETTLPEGTTNCPSGYQQGPDYTCWRFAVNPSTWYDARLSCQDDDPDADLAVIDTIEELNFVNNSRLAVAYWIGFNDLGNERIFRWIDCQAPSTWQAANWAPGAPSDLLGNNDCIELTTAGQWDDISCDTTRPFICKVQAKGFTEEDQYPSQFMVEATSALTASAMWVPSLSSCNLLGYYLIASDGGISDDVIIDVIGAISVQGEITGLKPDTLYVVSIVPYTAQGVLESRYETIIRTFDESTICPEGYEIGYNYGCYRFVTEPKNWDEARMDCMNTSNGDLAVVDTQDEMDFFIETGFGGYDWWVGLYDRAEDGLYRWVDCSDLSVWGQSQWDVGQPSDVDGSENCGQLQDNAKFNDRACERALPYVCEIIVKDFTDDDVDPSLFISTAVTENSVILRWMPSDYNCDIVGYTITYINGGLQIVEVPGGDSNSQLITGLMPETDYTFTLRAFTYMGPRNSTRSARVTTLPPANPCPEGWLFGYSEHCYKVVKTLLTWDEAREDCMSVEGGDLVVIESAAENQYLLNETLGNDFWIGYYDRAREGQWSWVDCGADTEFAYSNWAPGQPNDLNGIQDCGQVTNFGEYNDWECTRTMMYICEIWPKSYLPSQANPRFFRGEAVNPNTITLSWTPSVQFSCDVTAYRITYQDPRDTISTTIDVPGADASTVTISDLQDGAVYNFSISSVLATGPVLAAEETIVETPSLDDLCEPGWVPGYNYGCYKIVQNTMTWDEARADCQSIQDGDLVIMETEEEFNYLRDNLIEGDYWIGFYDKGTEGDWKWVDCQAPALWARSNWAVGQPNDLSGTQDCGQMLNAGTWNDWECDRADQYICEVTPKDWNINDQNPTLLRGEAINPNAIELQWRPSNVNCEVTGYRIYITVSPDDESYSVDVVGGETDSYMLKNLLANTVYTFDIAAITTSIILLPVGTLVRINTPASGECGNTEFLMESGFIISPNYPEPYSNNQDCVYTIMLPDSTKVVEINVETLDLEPGQDFLIIGSGAVVDENVLVTLTGSNLPENYLVTDSHQAWMRFLSDESMTASGFSLSYKSMTVEKDGEMIGSVTILLVDETAETLTPEDYDMFASSVAEQLNDFCMAAQENCEADINGNQFTADNVIITSVVEVSEGVEVTFWVSDPNDPKGNTAALTSEQLEQFLLEYEAPIEDGEPSFDYIIRPKNAAAIEEPWVIAVIVLLGVCFLLLCVVLIRDCFYKSDEKTPSMDSLQMMPNVTATVDSQNNESKRRDSSYNENVYFQSGAGIVEDETDIKKSAPPPSSPSQSNGKAVEVATTSFSTTSTVTEPTYAAPQKKASTKAVKADVEAAVEASEDEE